MSEPADALAQLIHQGDNAYEAGDLRRAVAIYQAAAAKGDPKHSAGVAARLGFIGRSTGLKLLQIQKTIEAQGEFPVFVADNLAVWGKTNSFILNPDFMRAVGQHRDLLPIANWHFNLNVILWAVMQVRRLDGDFVELGVFKGHTTLTVAQTVKFEEWKNRRWFLYDTFDGIPDDQLNEGWAEKNRTNYKGTFSFDEVRERFAPYPNIEVIQGRVPEVLAGTAPERIAFLHVDLNSAKAESAALDALFDRIVPGGVIVFDDYGWMSAYEQHVAIRHWMRQHGEIVLELPTGQGVFIKGQ